MRSGWKRTGVGAAAGGGVAAAAGLLGVGAGGWGSASAPAAVAVGAFPGEAGKVRAEPVRYGRDVRPLLSDRCFKCHGPDEAARQAELRLDEREAAVADRGGWSAIVPGDPEASALWQRVTAHDPEDVMPPPDSNKRALSPAELGVIRRWIEQGAPYEPHWAFVPPVRPAVPPVRRAEWVRNAIDAFVLSSLEGAGIEPSPEADRLTLLRRVYLDLTGLPPTPEEQDEFLGDTGPGAYERVVDRLLSEEPYRTRCAERLATPWLDASRYGDTCGIHMDAGRQMWLWRDWVLHAYRENMPFDRFVTEQIAGDLIPDATEEQKIASGFNRNHVTTDEGGAIAEEYLVEYAVDRTATTGSVLLGLTLGCARCHDHKYDPISMDEFYSMYAYFNSIEEPGLYSQVPDANRAFEPFIEVPRPEQRGRLAALRDLVAQTRADIEESHPEEHAQRDEFMRALAAEGALAWAPVTVTGTASSAGATLAPQDDGSVVASGANPDRDEHEILLRTDATGLRLITLEALEEASAGGRIGRAPNGNAVLNGITVEAAPVGAPDRFEPVPLTWAWADHSQQDGDFQITNVLDATDGEGWAVAAHQKPGGRVALLLAGAPFGFDGGTIVRVRLKYDSVYAQHTLARVRLSLGSIGDAALARLPLAASRWFRVGPFSVENRDTAFDQVFGPEEPEAFDPKRPFGAGDQFWRFDGLLADGQVEPLTDGINVTYVGKRVYAPADREVTVRLGSDDGFRLFIDGQEQASNRVDRAVAPDQDRATIRLHAGMNALVLKIVNTGGNAGFYYRAEAGASELTGDLPLALLPAGARTGAYTDRLTRAWRVAFLPRYREGLERIALLEAKIVEVQAAIPLTMVMKERSMPRETFVLTRGQYNMPDTSRPVQRGVPSALGRLPEGAPPDRRGLAQWLVAPENPLVARVAVNRLWEMLFGTGIVATSEDFGLQGEWPSHPELLDWLAVEFRERGWDTRQMLRLIVTSATYRQDSRVRPELRELDPGNRLLAYYPRRRLPAEHLRDQALYVAGLLVERLGGPSVKPYQPEGLWQEVAMPQSNTREYVRGEGEDLWRRSLYTYWKRAMPPPSLLTFDAPTREFCTIRRAVTNTPLQALVLWNDEQFVEAARKLAERTIRESPDDGARLERLFRRCTGGPPDEEEARVLRGALEGFRARYAQAEADAHALVSVGESPTPGDIDAGELASWTMVSSAVMNLYRTTTQE